MSRLKLTQDSPDKATEFSGDSSDSNVSVFALIEVPGLFGETMLGFENNCDNSRRLSLASSVHNQVGCGSMSVVPGRFEQETSDVHVASLGDGSAIFFVIGRAF